MAAIRTVSPATEQLVSRQSQHRIWELFVSQQEMVPQYFDLNKGKNSTQKILHFILDTGYFWEERFPCDSPATGVRLVIVKDSRGYLLKVRDKGVEEELSRQPSVPDRPEQGELF